jgi:hypothetical protein
MAAKRSKARFNTELIEGHKGVTAVIVPFDPEAVWQSKPVRLDARRDGWLVRGTLEGVRFEGYIGYRWNRYFILVEPTLRDAAKVSIGDTVSVVVEPTEAPTALAKAREQSKLTTAPKRGRADTVDLDSATSAARRSGSSGRTASRNRGSA